MRDIILSKAQVLNGEHERGIEQVMNTIIIKVASVQVQVYETFQDRTSDEELEVLWVGQGPLEV